MNTTTLPPRADKDRQIKLAEFAILVFKRLQRRGGSRGFTAMRKSPPAQWMR